MTIKKQYYTVNEVAAILDIHPQTVRLYLRRGLLKGVKIHGRGKWRIPVNVVDAMFN